VVCRHVSLTSKGVPWVRKDCGTLLYRIVVDLYKSVTSKMNFCQNTPRKCHLLIQSHLIADSFYVGQNYCLCVREL
jgi:hypothetical protein